jgi:purine-nucleoside phosphorylase
MIDEALFFAQIKEAAKVISSICPLKPQTCIVLGSGLAPMADRCQIEAEIKYSQIPHFPIPTTPGHEGVLLVARVGNVITYMMKGRYHYYEGYSTQEITFPFRVLAFLGVRNLILTNAAGGINPSMNPGDLMVIRDHLSMFCVSPLIGPNINSFGPRFPDQSRIYNQEFIEIILNISEKKNIQLHTGVYAYMQGPQYETPSEIRALKILGADAVGMSTVPEAIIASHCGMRILAMSCITNLAAGISEMPLSHAEVIEVGAAASERSITLLEAFLSEALL